MNKFKLVSEYKPTGDQPEAIKNLVSNYKKGKNKQTLLGVTGSGKTFTMANIIEGIQKPTLVIAHNKTLAAQLYNEFKEFFPDNAVEYFVSYYDYYQPEAYVPSTDKYIEKDSAINDEIDKLRHSATASLAERKDVIVISSVSCIYSLGDPIDYENMVLSLRTGMIKDRDEILKKLVDIQYNRNDINFVRGTFRVRGDIVEIFPSYSTEIALRIELFGDEIEKITEFIPLTGEIKNNISHISIFPASHFVTPKEKLNKAILEIEEELIEVVGDFKKELKLIEAQRILERTNYDMEMLREIGFCTGIENYSRQLSDREKNSTPHCLIDYFGEDFLMILDESHVTVPQIGAMYKGDKARKTNLVNYGFRLPSALENRPLQFREFEKKMNNVLFVSATPNVYEGENSQYVAEQIIRPTGLLDPIIEVRPTEGQIDDIISEINITIEDGSKVLITTLTKKMAEDLTDYLTKVNIKCRYLHSDIDTLERLEIIRSLRLGEFDVLIGINLLREGLDIPEVSAVFIIDADKEGFLRSATSLIQTVGRAARNVKGRVIMYGDRITKSMEKTIEETQRRRNIQEKYNKENGITPTSINKMVHDIIKISESGRKKSKKEVKLEKSPESMDNKELDIAIKKFKKEMETCSLYLQFERAIELRDKIKEYEKYRRK